MFYRGALLGLVLWGGLAFAQGAPEVPSLCSEVSAGSYPVGAVFCLVVPDPVPGETAFQWYKNGEPLTESLRVRGAGDRTLIISPLETGDTGDYTCAYEDAAKTTKVHDAGHLEVHVPLPVGGGVAGQLALAALLCGWGAFLCRPARRA